MDTTFATFGLLSVDRAAVLAVQPTLHRLHPSTPVSLVPSAHLAPPRSKGLTARAVRGRSYSGTYSRLTLATYLLYLKSKPPRICRHDEEKRLKSEY
jgi:hypothetical protein